MKQFIFLLTFLPFTVTHGQKFEDFSLKHSTKQDGLSLQFTVLAPDKKGISKYDTGKTYYWHKAQLVMGTQGGSSGQLLHGMFESFYPTKQLCEKGTYAKGLKDGEWHYWRMDGSLWRSENWAHGALKGTQIDYSEKGEIQKRTIIRGGKSRIEQGDTLVELSGDSKTVTLSDSSGNLVSVAHYKNNLLHGKQVSYTSNGEKTVTTYKNGELVSGKASEKTTGKKEKKPGVVSKLKSKFSKKEAKEPASGNKKTKEKKQATDKKKESSATPSEKKKFSLKKKAE